MASIRKLKKDVNYLSYELLTEVFAFKHFHPADFDLTDETEIPAIALKGCKEISRSANQLELEVEDKVYSIELLGFDQNRDLRTDIRPFVAVANAEENE